MISLETSDAAKLKGLLENSDGIKEISAIENSLNIISENGSRTIPKLIEIASKNEISVDSVALKRPSLEDVFIHHTGRTIRDEEGDGKGSFKYIARAGWR